MRLGATTDMRYIIVSGGKVFLKNLPVNLVRVVTVGAKQILWMHGKSYDIYDGAPKGEKS